MIIHYTWDYLKNSYFKKYSKTKDLVKTQIQKYKNIIEEIQENEKNKMKMERFENENDNNNDMEKDLEKFMEENL
jgi:hypothetical protein